MKKLIFCLFAIVLFLSACKNTLIFPTDGGIYSGQLIQVGKFKTDSFPIKIRFDFVNNQFQILPNSCNGNIEIKNNKISFNSQECSCWCNCCTTCDCGGSPILGNFDVILRNDSLILSKKDIINRNIFFELQKE